MLNVTGEVPRARSEAGSVASSRRSSAFQAVAEAANARTAILAVEAEAQRVQAQLASTRAECNEQHQAITAEFEAVHKSVREELQVSDQLRTAQNVQTVRVDAMGHRLGELNDWLLQRELRMETQFYDLSNQMNAMPNATDVLRSLQAEQLQAPTVGVKAGPVNAVPAPASSAPASSLKPSTYKLVVGETTVVNPILLPINGPVLPESDVERKPAQVQVKGRHDPSSALLSTKTTLMTNTHDQGVDLITLHSTEIDLFINKSILGCQTDHAVFCVSADYVVRTQFTVFHCR